MRTYPSDALFREALNRIVELTHELHPATRAEFLAMGSAILASEAEQQTELNEQIGVPDRSLKADDDEIARLLEEIFGPLQQPQPEPKAMPELDIARPIYNRATHVVTFTTVDGVPCTISNTNPTEGIQVVTWTSSPGG